MTCPCEWLKLVGDPRTICHAPFPKRSTVADDAEIQTTWKCMEISSIKLRRTSMTPTRWIAMADRALRAANHKSSKDFVLNPVDHVDDPNRRCYRPGSPSQFPWRNSHGALHTAYRMTPPIRTIIL